MSDKIIEMWQSRHFWKPAIITVLCIMVGASVARFFIMTNVISGREDEFKYKNFIYRTAAGEKVEEKDAWPSYVWAVRSGYYLREEVQKGQSLDLIVKNIQSLRSDIASKNENQREDYRTFLRTNYKTPDPMIHLSYDNRWKKIEDNKRDLEILKVILSGSVYKPTEPDLSFDLFTQEFVVVFGIISQLMAFFIGLVNFSEKHRYSYRYRENIRASKLDVKAFATFIVFSPGALPIIVVMLFSIARHQIPDYLKERKESKYLIPKIQETSTESQEELLRRLRKRVHGDSSV